MIPTDVIDTLVGTWRSISALGAPLAEAQWRAPTDLPGWTVQDLLSHVIGTERMLQGLPPAPPRATEAPHVRNPIGDFNENDVALRRDRPGAEVLAEWNELRVLREATLAAGDDDYFAQPMTMPTGPGTMGEFLSIRILDCWTHEQDMRRALGTPGNLGCPAAEHTIDRLIRTIPIVVGKRAACPEGRAVRLLITHGVEREVTCEVNGGRAGFVDEPQSAPLATITFGTEAFVVLATGRRPAREVVDVTVDGDTDLGQRVVENFNMMI